MMCRLFKKRNDRDPITALKSAAASAALPGIVPDDLCGRRLAAGADLTVLFEATAYLPDRPARGDFRIELLRPATLFRNGRRLFLEPDEIEPERDLITVHEAGADSADNLRVAPICGFELHIPVTSMLLSEAVSDVRRFPSGPFGPRR